MLVRRLLNGVEEVGWRETIVALGAGAFAEDGGGGVGAVDGAAARRAIAVPEACAQPKARSWSRTLSRSRAVPLLNLNLILVVVVVVLHGLVPALAEGAQLAQTSETRSHSRHRALVRVSLARQHELEARKRRRKLFGLLLEPRRR